MLQDNPLLAQLKQQLHQQTPRIEGTVRSHEKGYGFLETENKKSYFIPANKMKKLLNGDKVSGQIIDNKGKESFDPETLIESSWQSFLGKINFDNKVMVIIPENGQQMSIRCKVNKNVHHQLKSGDWIKAELISHAMDNNGHFFAEVIQFVAEEKSPYLLWQKTLARYNLEAAAPSDESLEFIDNEHALRKDLTHIDFFTIDGRETMDMDDAISIGKDEQGNYVVNVAIADPSTYISEKSTIDHEALQRCFSTYLPNYTVPMLPKSLANDQCSLKQDEQRPAVVCQISITADGDIIHDETKFCLGLVTSKAKLAYNDVSDFIEKDVPLPSLIDNLPQQLMLLVTLAETRMKWRHDNALLFKENNEYRFIFDDNKQVINIFKESRRIAQKMIEEIMVIANQAFADKISQDLGFAVFNVHNGFEPKYFDSIIKLLNDDNITEFTKDTLATLECYKDIRHRVEQNDVLEHRLRRYQSPADFSFEPRAHFGMGFPSYATWTSPIRKYGDLINHRLIKAMLLQQSPEKPDNQVLVIMNERRKALRLAERDITEKLYCQFLSDKIGQIYNAEIIDINRGGAKVRLTDIGAIAFMPLSLIHPVRNEITAHPEDGVIKIKEESSYHILDTIKVVINEVKSDNASIILKLANDA